MKLLDTIAIPLLFLLYFIQGVRIAYRNAIVSIKNDIASSKRFYENLKK